MWRNPAQFCASKFEKHYYAQIKRYCQNSCVSAGWKVLYQLVICICPTILVVCSYYMQYVQILCICICLRGKAKFGLMLSYQLGDLSNPELRLLTDQLNNIKFSGELPLFLYGQFNFIKREIDSLAFSCIIFPFASKGCTFLFSTPSIYSLNESGDRSRGEKMTILQPSPLTKFIFLKILILVTP